jgi:hypothetical protein
LQVTRSNCLCCAQAGGITTLMNPFDSVCGWPSRHALVGRPGASFLLCYFALTR